MPTAGHSLYHTGKDAMLQSDSESSRCLELLEWTLVRLLIVAERCESPVIRLELMHLVDQADRMALQDSHPRSGTSSAATKSP